ncbi:hypothetical protein D9613_005028 [Agrocybe pediades]|uniref:Uncharacterized protein n=1 Tax=Agrocybe pediades TaxID=84607 RepID=A0A8H4QYI4_9AGAR|nr:hypothetical protein D9613_005028 [Agrocybe pediades]
MSSTTTTTTRSPRASRIASPSSSAPPSGHSPRRPSIANTMHWLSRTSNQVLSTTSSPPYSPSKPHRVAEPKRVRTIDIINPPARNGTLGSGAIVVRTPDEALRETGVRLSPEMFERENLSTTPPPAPRQSFEKEHPLKSMGRTSTIHSRESSTATLAEVVSSPTSPPLPPLPLADAEEEAAIGEPDSPTSSYSSKPPPRPTRSPPSPPSRRSSMKVRTVLSTIDDAPSVPPLPPHVVASTQPPPFHALLISEPSLMITDPSKILVTLETCTTTHRTTLATIQSRQSHLSNYLSSLLSSSQASDTKSIASMYSNETDDLAIYNRHLTSQGLLPHSGSIHLFLDRPSSPYSHILAYLRTPVIDGQPETLPRSLQVNSPMHSQDRLESLIEVRDEAAFLNLESLQRLCADEIRHRYGPRLHTRNNSNSGGASIHSLHASVYSLHTLLERVETDLVSASAIVNSSLDGQLVGLATSSTPSSPSKKSTPSVQQPVQDDGAVPSSRSGSPPTPQSWEGPTKGHRSQSSQSIRNSGPSVKPAPAGWI